MLATPRSIAFKLFSLGEKVAAYSPSDEGQFSNCKETALSSNSDPHPPFEYSGHLFPEGEGFKS